MKRNYLIYILLCILFLSTSSCKDDLLYGGGEAGEGKCVISGTVKFKSFTPALNGSTRTPGNAIKEINSLCVLLYDESGVLVKKYPLKKGLALGEGVYVLTEEDRNGNTNNETVSGVEENFPSAESKTFRATFKLTVPYGNYYIYAVANMGDLASTDGNLQTVIGADVNIEQAIQTVEGLKSISLHWNPNAIASNNQMFGHFFSDDNIGSEAPLLAINSSTTPLQAWLRRAASKVTVAYDGSRLADGVSIYIKSVTIKDIPTECYLGQNSKIVKTTEKEDEKYGNLIEVGECIEYSSDASYHNWPTITNNTPYYYYVDAEHSTSPISKTDYEGKEEEYAGKAHAEKNAALFFYENMQGEGEDKSQKDEDNDGIPDKPDVKKNDMPDGTYIEVEVFYNSDNPECLGSGEIKYRFMLGKNITTNYDAERNHHYKLTLIFNRFANDPDWHIHRKKYLEVTQPKVLNYQGQYFEPDETKYNLGNTFKGETIITVTSFDENTETGATAPVQWTVTYREDDQKEFSDKCSWLSFTEPTDEEKKQNTIQVKFDPTISTPDAIDIDNNLKIAEEKGTDGVYYNLAKGTTLNSYGIGSTANCYMVDAPGWYSFPLVYGNAVYNGTDNENSYKYNEATGEDILSTFKNYLGNDIKSPYIKDDTSNAPFSAELVWQDELNLIVPSSIKYDSNLYGTKGGIVFHIDKSNIKQGNAVIAVKDGQQRVMWSWHIWVTNFTGLEETITVTNHDGNEFKLMPVNLGWCSGHNEKVLYYKERKCEVKFTAGDLSKTITFIKKSHMAFSLGNNLYYQWGRKDPFWGTNANWGNKVCYVGSNQQETNANPVRFYNDDYQGSIIQGILGEERKNTREVLQGGLLIQYPGNWHNPPREAISSTAYRSVNKTYANLWKGDEIPPVTYYKTVYDPCPVGYQVSSYNAFTGFTNSGDGIEDNATVGYGVLTENIVDQVNCDKLYEFYTNITKLQSIIFPQSGYRDWDAMAGVYHYNSSDFGTGYIWAMENRITASGETENSPYSYYFEFSRKDYKQEAFISPKNSFYPCDGCPIRPCVYNPQDTSTP